MVHNAWVWAMLLLAVADLVLALVGMRYRRYWRESQEDKLEIARHCAGQHSCIACRNYIVLQDEVDDA